MKTGKNTNNSWITWNNTELKQVNFKYGISFISIEQAKNNLEKEMPNWDFEKVKNNAKDKWSNVLNQIEVEGGTEAHRRSFYTALYRSYERMINITEEGKYYSNYDKKIHKGEQNFYADDWVWDTFFQTLKIFNTWLITEVLQPMRALYLRMPAVATLVLVIGAGYIIGGIRSAIVVGGLTLFIALSPWWDRALVTLYMATFGVFISTIIGFTVGILSFQNKHTANFMLGVCDIFQTFPSFVYLIPVMMLFGVTDTSVLIAVVVYATIPATRYTIEGLRSVPVALHDAATMSGVTKLQRLLKIEFPLAFPHMMLGLNQTIVFALFMVIIGAFIGTEDLGQYILKALSDKKGAGIGLTLGLCVAFIGLIFDHLIRTWVGKRKKHLGIG